MADEQSKKKDADLAARVLRIEKQLGIVADDKPKKSPHDQMAAKGAADAKARGVKS